MRRSPGSSSARRRVSTSARPYPYTSAATTLATILPPRSRPWGSRIARPRSPISTPRPRQVRDRARISGWENVASDPGWGGLRIRSPRRQWSGRSLAELADELHSDPLELAFHVLLEDRSTSRSSSSACRSRTSRRSWPSRGSPCARMPKAVVPGTPSLMPGWPHPRTYGSRRARSGPTSASGDPAARDRHREAHSVPAARLGAARPRRRPRGCPGRPRRPIRRRSARRPLYAEPAHYPRGIEHVVVNGRPAILHGGETGERDGPAAT